MAQDSAMKKEHILIVEDEAKIAEIIRKYLVLENYRSSHTCNGSFVASIYNRERPDLIILDISLPDMDGIEVCKQLRRFTDVPIIMLTARVDEVDRLLGFEVGADDYVCKPFLPKELIARVRALLNRVRKNQQSEIIECAKVTLDITQHRVNMNRTDIRLTQNEFNLLKTLMLHPNKVFSRQELLTATHGQYFENYERTIDSHIKNVRKKFLKVDPSSTLISSIYGLGYKFVDE